MSMPKSSSLLLTGLMVSFRSFVTEKHTKMLQSSERKKTPLCLVNNWIETKIDFLHFHICIEYRDLFMNRFSCFPFLTSSLPHHFKVQDSNSRVEINWRFLALPFLWTIFIVTAYNFSSLLFCKQDNLRCQMSGSKHHQI